MRDDIRCSIHNKFEIEVIRDGKQIQKAKAYNVVTNKLWDYLITTTTAFATYIQYGSGSGTPSASDTSLFNRAGGVAVTEVSLDCDYANKVITRVCKIVLGLNDAVGVTLREVGMAAGSADGTLTTHAMLQDMNGNPISIAKTDTDIINIYATIYAHWSCDGDNITFYPKGGIINALVGQSNCFGDISFGVTYGTLENNNVKTWSKTSTDLANKRMTYTLPRLTQSEGNIDGVGAFMGNGNYDGILIRKGQGSFDKFTIQNETVGTGDGETTLYSTKFSCPYNATVYINGVAQTSQNVQVKCAPIYYANLIPISAESEDDDLILMAGATYTPALFYNADYPNGNCGYFLFSSCSGSYAVTGHVDGSNDLENWTENIASVGLYPNGTGWIQHHKECFVPEQYQNFKYFRVRVTDGTETGCRIYNAKAGTSKKNIIFNNPPSVGDVITIKYDTDCIPKDSDHVLDATITFQFGEYNE